jgi:hypothetical protein
LVVAIVIPPVAAVECESGQMFAEEHIVPAAHAGLLGDDVNPGMGHGYSICAR